MTGPADWIMSNGVWKSLTPGVEDVGTDPGTDPGGGGGGGGGGTTTPPAYIASGNVVADSVAITVSWPTTQVNDIGLLEVHTANQALPATPTGWTYITGYPVGVGTAATAGSVMVHWLWKRASSTSEAAVTVGDSGNHQIAQIHIVRGALTSATPINVVPTPTTLGSASTAVTIPGGTTTTENCLVFAFVGNSTDSLTQQTSGPSSDWSSDLTSKATIVPMQRLAGTGGGISILYGVKATAGAYSNITTTLVTSSTQVRGSFAIAPEPSDGSGGGGGGGGGGTPTGLRRYLGVSDLPQANWATFVFGDTLVANTDGSDWTSTGGIIDDLAAVGARAIMRVTPGNAFYRNPAVNTSRTNSGGHVVAYDSAYPVGAFLPYVWEFYWDQWFAGAIGVSGGETKLRNGFTNGNLSWEQLIDDIGGTSDWQNNNNFSRLVSYAELERIAGHAKADMPYCPMGVRTSITNMAARTTTARPYLNVDLGVSTFVPTRPSHWDGTQARANSWIASEVRLAASIGLANAAAFNLARGWWEVKDPAEPDITDGWACYAVTQKLCGISPLEIKHGGSAMINALRGGQSAVAGINIWSWNFGGAAYMASTRSDNSGRTVPGELANLKALAAGTDEGPYSLHNLPAP